VRICWGSAEQNVQQFVQQKLSRALESIVFADKFIALERFTRRAVKRSFDNAKVFVAGRGGFEPAMELADREVDTADVGRLVLLSPARPVATHAIQRSAPR
jgi:ribonucleotide monophosphatase NagD (HAD superfamily)